MWEKIKSILVIALSALVVGGFFVACLLKSPDEISLSERRPLAQFPEVDVREVASGKFMKDFEKYAADQFPFRETFRKIYRDVSLGLLGQSDLEGLCIYGDMAVAQEYPVNEQSLDYAIQVFQRIYETCLKEQGSNVYLAVVPDKNYFLSDISDLSMDYDHFFERMRKGLPQMTYLDLTPLLELSDYYRTDPHWRQEELVDVAQYLAGEMGAPLTSPFEKQEVDELFYGSYWGQTAGALPGEKMYYLTHEGMEGCQVYDHQNGRPMEMYDLSKAGGRDPYELYLSGPLSYITIENPKAAEDKELIIFRDSFGSAIAPLLVEGYGKITVLDIRYLPSYALKNQVDFHGQDVLFLYSTSVLNHSETIK